MIKGKVIGEERVYAKLDKLSVNVLVSVKAFVKEFTFRLMRHVQNDKLSGQVLNVRTNLLRSSIPRGTGFVETDTSITGHVGLGGAGLKVAKYGAAHEYGATIPARVVEPKNKKALKWGGDKPIFAKRVSIPSFKMPERSFLRSALRDMEPAFAAGVKKAIEQAQKDAQ